MENEELLKDTITNIYSNDNKKTNDIQFPKEEDEAEKKQLIKLYKWGEKNLLTVILFLVGSSFLIGVYYQDRATTRKELITIKDDIKKIKTEIQNIKINKNDIDNIKYRIESLKKVNNLELRLKSIEVKNKVTKYK